MNEYLLSLITKYKNKGVLIDTNILLLYLVGSLDLNMIRGFKRTANFTENDFNLISNFIKQFNLKITTPHVLTEVSDFIDNRQNLQAVLKIFIEHTKEIFIESVELSKKDTFFKFGLADTSVTYSAKDSYLIFTDDRPLYGFLINSQIDAVNLDQIRMI
ncbi:PIN domain-containing protein [soil metagenome]